MKNLIEPESAKYLFGTETKSYENVSGVVIQDHFNVRTCKTLENVPVRRRPGTRIARNCKAWKQGEIFTKPC